MTQIKVDAVAIAAFKQQWTVVTKAYPVTNNDAALLFRALSDLASASQTSQLQDVSEVLNKQIDRIINQFPQELAPLLRQMAGTCVNAHLLCHQCPKSN